MIRVLLVVLAVTSISAQEPDRHDKYKDDPWAYCFNPATSGSQGARRARDPHWHQCACHLYCTRDQSGAVIGDQEDANCELYCTRARCNCHVESPCEGN